MNKKRKLFKVLTAISTATLLEACAGQAPAPCVAPEDSIPQQTAEQVAPQPTEQQVAAPAAGTIQPTAGAVQPAASTVQSATKTVPQANEQTVVQSNPQAAKIKEAPKSSSSAAQTSAPQQSTTPVQSAVSSSSSNAPQQSTTPVQPAVSSSSSNAPQQSDIPQSSSSEAQTVETPVDPYSALPSMVSDIFDHAKNLFNQSNIDGAVAYLQRFRILKPLWNEWENRADSLLNVFGQSNAERAKQYEPLVLEIKNMNRANAAYSLVAEAADSLIALVPGDSLVNFAKEQKNIAYKNTIGKAMKEKEQILSLAEGKALFDEALKKANEFKMRFRDFENELQIDNLIAYIQRLQNSINDEDKKYWESHDAQKALAEVDELIEKKAYAKAKVLVERLKASKLRQQAAEKYQKLADVVCTEKRKTASQLYAQATKQKKADKKKEILLKAIGALNSCSDDYPQYEKIKTVTDNIIFLKKELER